MIGQMHRTLHIYAMIGQTHSRIYARIGMISSCIYTMIILIGIMDNGTTKNCVTQKVYLMIRGLSYCPRSGIITVVK